MQQRYLLGEGMTAYVRISLCTLFLALWSISSGALGADRFYHYTPDGKAFFDLSNKKILVKFSPKVSFEDQARLLSSEPLLKPLAREMMLPSPKVVIAEMAQSASEKEILDLIDRIHRLPAVEYANPFLIYKDGTSEAAQDQFIVKLKQAEDFNRLDEMVKLNGAAIQQQYAYDPLLYFVKVTKQSKGKALELANQFAESGVFATAEPDMLKLLKRFNTNDTYLAYQWALNNTGSSIQYNGTAGADMKVFSAWGMSTGSSSIKVAVIDEGVDLMHPDLINNLLPGFDGTQQNSGGAPQGNDAHGTNCAGIIAAMGNNNLGVTGVAYNCKIVPIRIAYGSGSSWITSNSWIGTSLDWAWNQGAADVLSNSWGGGSSSTLINDPITRATTQGRGGLGAAVLFAAGNNNSSNSYPATLTNVISVIAMSMCNQRKNPSSCDGETWWGSNYGTGADIAAPGVKIYSTDISGSAGYNTASGTAGDYYATFNGTSSATPNAAGVMALILSVNPSLTYAQSRQILESTCDKVGGYTYNSGVPGQPNGTWSNDLGYGRVNAFAALQLTNPAPCTAPPAAGTASVAPATICSSTSVLLSLSGITHGTGQTYQWQSSPDNATWTNISGATGQSAATTATASTWYKCIVTCSGQSTSSSSTQVTLTNPIISTFPSTQNFDGSSSLPCGWTNQDANADGKTWGTGTLNPRSAPNCVSYSYSSANAANDWLFSPPLNLTAGTNYRVRFWYRVRSATYPESFEVRFGTGANAASMGASTVFSVTNITNTAYTEGITSNISPATTGLYYVGFKATSAANMYDIHLDDVTFEVTVACTTPPVGGTASGSLAAVAGNSTPGSYSLTGHSGTSLQWQTSSNGGTSWTDVSGATGANANIPFAIAGNWQVRAKVSRSNCTDAFSNVLAVTVSPPVGDNVTIPFNVGLPFSGSVSNAAGSGYSNAYTGTNNQASADVFYRFTTGPCTDSVRVSSCGTAFDSYVHLLNGAGTNLNSNDDNGALCLGNAGSLKVAVTPNTTYYAVFEGYGSNAGTIVVSISEVDNPVASASISVGGPTTFCSPGSVLLTASAGSSYLWSTGAVSQSITASSSGNYSVAVSDVNGCSASASQLVTVNPTPGVYNVSGGGSYCSVPGIGVSVSLSGSEVGVTYTFSYTAGGTAGTLSGNGNALTLSGVTGQGTIYVTAQNDLTGCQTNMNGSASVQITAASTFYQDFDGDGYGNAGVTQLACAASVGYVADNTDCNDADGAVHTAQTYYVDADLDGYGSTATESICSGTAPSGYSTNSSDCNDGNAAIHPGMAEICGNGVDENCNGQTDENCTLYTFYLDSDGDGYGDLNVTTTSFNPNPPTGYVTNFGDCNDSDGAIHTPQTYFVDADLDGYGSTSTANICSATAPVGYAVNSDDCNDTDAAVNPGATEVCNGSDDDCDGQIDEGVSTIAAPAAISGPASVCRNQTGIVFTATPVPGATSYVWTLPTGATGSSSSNVITLSFSSTYVAGNLCVKATNGCTTSPNFCRSVGVYTSRPGVPVTISGPAVAVCAGSTQTYSIANVTNATIYNWTAPANASIASGQGTNTVTVSFSGSFTSGTISVNAGNCVGNSSNRTLSLSSKPGTPSTITGTWLGACGGSTQTYTCPAVSTASSYAWTFPAGTTILNGEFTNSIEVILPPSYSSGTVSVKAVNACGTSTTRSKTVRSIPLTPSSITGPVHAVCSGSTQTYSCPVSTSGATGYTWTFPAGTTINSGQGSTSVNVTMPASYTSGTVSVVATNACGSSTARSITVRSAPAQPGTISGPASNLCGGVFTYTVAAVTSATSYIWSAPAGCSVVNNGPSATITYPSTSVIGNISVSAVNACGTGTARTLAIVTRPATPAAITGSSSVCPSATGVSFSTTAIGGLTYTWTKPSSVTLVSGQGTAAISCDWGTVAGSVTVKASNTCGTSATRSMSVAIAACRQMVEDDVQQNLSAPEVSVYPNPGTGKYQLRVNEQATGGIVLIYNMQGKLIQRLDLSNESLEVAINLENQPAASYLVKYQAGNFHKEIMVIKQ